MNSLALGLFLLALVSSIFCTLPKGAKILPRSVLPPANLATTDECVDVNKNCAQYVDTLCTMTAYKTIMASECAKTCNLCCADKNPNCAQWSSKGFCTNSFYTAATKKQNCPETCKLCTN